MLPNSDLDTAFTLLERAAALVEERAAIGGISYSELEMLSTKVQTVLNAVAAGAARRRDRNGIGTRSGWNGHSP